MRYLFIILTISLFACSKVKEIQHTDKQPRIEVDDFSPPMGFNLFKRTITPELKKFSEDAIRIGRGIGRKKPRPPRNDTTTPPQPPPDTTTYSGDYVLFYDFDGGYLTNTSWNYNGPVVLQPSGLTAEAIAQVLTACINAYAPYNILVTADSTEFFKRSNGKRQRVYITQTYEFWGRAGGVAYIGSMLDGYDEPAFVFSGLLSYSGDWIGDAGIHEAGHTIGLRHQADWKNGVMTSGYSQGFAPNRAPHLGVSYYDADGGEFLKEPWLQITDVTWYIRTAAFVDQLDHQIIISKVGIK